MIILLPTVCKLSPQSISIIYYLECEGVPDVCDLAVVVALGTQTLPLLALAPSPAARLAAPAVAAPRAEAPVVTLDILDTRYTDTGYLDK